MTDKWQALRDVLHQEHIFPSEYTFKFIVPMDKLVEATTLLPDARISTRASKTGKYISITAYKVVISADEVIAVYHRLAVIEGLMSL